MKIDRPLLEHYLRAKEWTEYEPGQWCNRLAQFGYPKGISVSLTGHIGKGVYQKIASSIGCTTFELCAKLGALTIAEEIIGEAYEDSLACGEMSVLADKVLRSLGIDPLRWESSRSDEAVNAGTVEA